VNEAVLLDNSAWARLGTASLPAARSQEVAEAVEARQVFVSLPFLLDAGYSARDARAHRELLEELTALPWATIDRTVERRAIEAQGQLARAGHHRMPPADVIVAALAERHGLAVLHYDRDFDLLAARTDLRFSSSWLAAPGSL
jgi:predicted nucleic acid-binding protein